MHCSLLDYKNSFPKESYDIVGVFIEYLFFLTFEFFPELLNLHIFSIQDMLVSEGENPHPPHLFKYLPIFPFLVKEAIFCIFSPL